MAGIHLRRALLLAALASSAAGVPVVACGEPYSATPEPVEQDAGVEAAVDAAVPDPCDHARLPAPPPVDDAPGDELPPFFLALREVTLANETNKIVGYDLDGVCTCDPHPESAHEAGASCIASGPRCDLERGIDNAVSVLTAQLSPFFSVDAVPRGLIARGRRTLLIQIGRYNGRLNDKEVAFAIALSDGILEKGCPTSVEDPVEQIWTPGWCGDDRWSFLPESVIPTTKQPLVQGLGFVRDGILSLQLAGALQLPFDDTSVLSLGSAVMTGTLVPLDESLKPRDRARPPTEREKRLFSLENAIVGGRISAVNLLSALGTIERPSANDAGTTYLCQDPSFELVRQGVCDATDIPSAQALDFDPGAKCDSLSLGIAFTAFAALPGDVHVRPPVGNPCSPGADGQPPDSGLDPPYRCGPMK